MAAELINRPSAMLSAAQALASEQIVLGLPLARRRPGTHTGHHYANGLPKRHGLMRLSCFVAPSPPRHWLKLVRAKVMPSIGHCSVLCRRRASKTSQCSIQSAHFSTCPSGPHGMTGTEEVEFFGEPSISLSEYTM
jgi:hypothetical protein